MGRQLNKGIRSLSLSNRRSMRSSSAFIRVLAAERYLRSRLNGAAVSQPHETLYPAQMHDGIERTRVLNEYRIELASLIDEAREGSRAAWSIDRSPPVRRDRQC